MTARVVTNHLPSHVPAQISAQDFLLASRIFLPPNSIICYALLKSTSPEAIELARRSVMARYATSPIQESMLTSISISHDPHIYIFKVESSSASSTEVFRSLILDELSIQETSTFQPPSASVLFPNDKEQTLIVHFFDALRSRLIHDIVESSYKQAPVSQRPIKRFKTGFLMSQSSPLSGWEYKPVTRTLVFCDLKINFSYSLDGTVSHIVIHPILLSTPFLDIAPSLPLPAGTPIILLPFGTPAYFLAGYSGPTAGLIKQFHSVFQGLGGGDWSCSSSSSIHSPAFIIGWITVENKQGDDKGTTIIYPTKLCLSYLPLNCSRGTLDYIPDLPTPLQPSPQASRLCSSDMGNSIPVPTFQIRRSFSSSSAAESFNSFRALTLSSNGLEQVTVEVGEYIDAVLRERERERERLRREREAGSVTSPKAIRVIPTNPIEPIEHSVSSSSTLSSTLAPVLLPPNATELPSLQITAAAQSFYPSPPQSDPHEVDANLGRSAEGHPLKSEGTSFDSYDMEPTWPRPMDDYLDVHMDNMDFGINDITLEFNLDLANSSSTAQNITPFNGGKGSTTASRDIEFGDAFTDDDFSFFDQPSKPKPSALQSLDLRAHSISSLSVGTIGRTATNLRDDLDPTQTTGQLPLLGDFMGGFTPLPMDHLAPVSGLLPSSPVSTPDHHATISTPTVHLEPDAPLTISESMSHPGTGLFEAIPFAAYHREADDKYSIGKFALPTPPQEAGYSDGACVSPLTSPSRFSVNAGWRSEYDAITDPRVGLVKKLIGVKRKSPSNLDCSPPSKKAICIVSRKEWDTDEDTKHETGDSDVDSVDDGEGTEDSDNAAPSRPTTPPPSYLPLGPTLVITHFQHAHLLRLSVPLRPPDAAVHPLNLTSTSNPPPSVPTPVSPAAMMGAASHKSRSLEAAAFSIAVEVVENPLWAESWKANATGVDSVRRVWSTDIKAVQNLFNIIPGLQAPLTLSNLFGLDDIPHRKEDGAPSKPALQLAEAPMISIGKGEAVIQVLPPALRFWEKLGLNPKGGRKNLTAFMMFEENSEKRSFMEQWLVCFRNSYQARHYGYVTLGHPTNSAIKHLVPLRFDVTFRKSLTTFVSSLICSGSTTVVFLVLPMTLLSLSSPELRQILSVTKKVLATYGASILFKLIPEQHIYTGLARTPAYDSSLDNLSASVYNRILVPIERLRPRPEATSGESDSRSNIMAPSFTLARPTNNQVSFSRTVHAPMGVVDRFTLLHVAYHVTSCRKWIIACCVDQRGENHELGVWLTHSPGEHESEQEHTDEEYVVKKVWDFAMQFAKKTDVEWRVVFAKLGGVSPIEMEAWNALLSLNVLRSREHIPLHHSLVCVIPDAPWSFLSPKTSLSNNLMQSPSVSKHPAFFTDISSTTYAVFPNVRLPITLSPSQSDVLLVQPFIAEPLIPPSHATANNSHPLPTSAAHHAVSPPSLSRPNSAVDQRAIPLLPRSSSILLQIPHLQDSTSASNTSMIHIHLLRTYDSAYHTQPSSATSEDKQLLEDVTHNYYQLSVLSKTRWKLDGIARCKGLPFHLAATDAMRMALDNEWNKSDCGVES